ncbi:alpha/beta hydrolase [Escherichia fergusonii]|uniref:alpha/beta hydrolase n=1 Tax=Escherichia fergusonii TaxID=564 RepID=UPI0015EF11FA|nr:alpha/beta hydrolase [Escherichia fergusonii]MBZ4078292.1 alpha/beta hydrolase [Escherichia fergusonii]MBZ4109957.1 alpha/beta hydrolase [Escherichia fergusonii]MBZ4111367.1 alpha/beta hydrolase [Escherichia fergusonii]MBZ4122901.1 alpha/beta hydrolase [Escherichia fergusonii]MBZ4127939.1 alpha/beta hydrolase [Escherichia fergusonii]
MIVAVNKRVLKIVFILFVILFCVYLLPRIAINFFYYPDDKIYGPDPWSAESVEFTAKDGTRLHGWFIPSATGPAENAIATVIHAHDNAGNMSAHWPLVSWLPERNFNVFMFDYRGFGKSKGRPSQAGLLDDTQSAINVVRHRSDVNPQRLVLFGQSIGGANMVSALGNGDREGIRAVILDSTFASYSSIANQMIPGSGFFMDDSYNAERFIAEVSPIPVLIIHGKADRVIPWEQGERLYDLTREPKQKINLPDGEHIDAFSERHGGVYRDQMVNFILNALNTQ